MVVDRRYYCAEHPADSLVVSHISRAAGDVEEIEIAPCPQCTAVTPHFEGSLTPEGQCPLCKLTRERDRYEEALKAILDVTDENPGTRGFPTILAIIKKAMTPEPETS